MADRISKLRGVITGDSSGWTAAVNRGIGDANRFTSSAQRGFQKLGNLFNNLGGILAGGAFATGIKSALDELDRIDELSTAFGIGTADLQKLSLVAKQSGVELDGVAKATTKMYRAIADNPDVFSNIGLSAENLSALDLPGKLGAIGDALNKIEGDEQRVAAAMDIFGKSGTDVLPLLLQGTEGIAKAAAELEAMGGIFSDEEIAKAAKANDALDKAGKSLKIMVSEVAIALAPGLEEAAYWAGKLSGWLDVVQGWAVGLGDWLGGTVYGAGDRALGLDTGNQGFVSRNPYSPAEIQAFRDQARTREAAEGLRNNLRPARDF